MNTRTVVILACCFALGFYLSLSSAILTLAYSHRIRQRSPQISPQANQSIIFAFLAFITITIFVAGAVSATNFSTHRIIVLSLIPLALAANGLAIGNVLMPVYITRTSLRMLIIADLCFVVLAIGIELLAILLS